MPKKALRAKIVRRASGDIFLCLVCQDLISRSAFAFSWHTNAEQSSDGRRNVGLTDDAVCGVAFLDALAGSDEDRRQAGIEASTGGRERISMGTVVAFFEEEDDIAAFWTIHAE